MGVQTMRVARMGYTQRVTKKDSKGRITSSWVRVRKVVPEGLAPSFAAALHRQEDADKKSQHRARACRVDREVLGGYRSGGGAHQRFSGTHRARQSEHAGSPAAMPLGHRKV